MPIRCVLHLNPFKKDKGLYYARIKSIATLDLDQIIEHGENRAGWGVHPSLVKAILTRYFELIPILLLDGYRLVTPIAEYWLVLEGEFESKRERINLKKHKVHIASAVTRDVTYHVQREARLQLEYGEARYPELGRVCDGASRICDRVITRGGAVTVTGEHLKFDPTDEKQGVFLRKDGAAHRIRIEEVITNKPKTLIIGIPDDLSAGDYWMYVYTKVRHTSEIREGMFHKRLHLNERGEETGKH